MNYKYIVVIILIIPVVGGWMVFKFHPTTYSFALSPDSALSTYKNAFLDVQNLKYSSEKEKRFGDNTFWVRQSLRDNLEKLGFNIVHSISPENNPKSTDILVRCFIEDGIGIPIFVRHFKIKTVFIKRIEIKFYDAQSNKEIAKAVLFKNFFDRRNNLDEVDNVFEKIKQEQKLTGTRGKESSGT